MSVSKIKFPKNENTEFFATVRSRVNAYFKENKISKAGDWRMVTKTISMIIIYVLPYILILTQVTDVLLYKFLLWIAMGLGLAGMGLSVMHDAVHGAYSSNKLVNRVMANTMTFIGGSKFTWNVQHNQKHHTYTNVDGIDEDINPGAILRFSPHKKLYWMHRFQHLYAWFFYGLMTVSWSTEKDFRQLIKYKIAGLFDNENKSFSKTFSKVIFSKIVFQFLTVVLPLIILPDPWYLILLFIFTMHFVAGLIMACIFQPAHVMPTSEYPLPDNEGTMENNWAIHQMLTTANFAPNSKILRWYAGGLTHQIEHHLFPSICHIHYKDLSEIVEKTAKEFGLPYNVQPSFYAALKYHTEMLKNLGRFERLPATS